MNIKICAEKSRKMKKNWKIDRLTTKREDRTSFFEKSKQKDVVSNRVNDPLGLCINCLIIDIQSRSLN